MLHAYSPLIPLIFTNESPVIDYNPKGIGCKAAGDTEAFTEGNGDNKGRIHYG